MICNTISEFERYIPLAIIHASFVVILDTIIIAGNLLIIVIRKRCTRNHSNRPFCPMTKCNALASLEAQASADKTRISDLALQFIARSGNKVFYFSPLSLFLSVDHIAVDRAVMPCTSLP